MILNNTILSTTSTIETKNEKKKKIKNVQLKLLFNIFGQRESIVSGMISVTFFSLFFSRLNFFYFYVTAYAGFDDWLCVYVYVYVVHVCAHGVQHSLAQ